MPEQNLSPEEQAALDATARSVMQQIAAGRTPDEVARDLHLQGWQKPTADGFVAHIAEQWQAVMADPRANAGIYLQMRYPELRPVGSVPSLYTMHGIGTAFYGARGRDVPTGTYVKTQCFCVVFFPIFALASYRVASSGSGWALIGRVPLSRFAKTWNILVLLAILACVGVGLWGAHTGSEEYQASSKLSRAEKAAAAGNLVEAGRLYGEVARSRTAHAATARTELGKLVERPELDKMPLSDVTRIFEEWVQSGRPGDANDAAVKHALALVKQHAAAQSQAAAHLLVRLGQVQREAACKALGELLAGPCANLPPADTVEFFRTAANLPQDMKQKAEFAALGRAQCDRLAKTNLDFALGLLAVVAPLDDRANVEKELKSLLGAPLDKATVETVGKTLRTARDIAGPAGQDAVGARGLDWCERHPQTPPREALALLDELAGWNAGKAEDKPDPVAARLAAARRGQLEKLVAADPGDVDMTVRLALVLEEEGRHGGGKGSSKDSGERIGALLTPIRGKLGTGEGARLLGQHMAAKGKFDESYALLAPYLEKRLDAFHEAEKAFDDAEKQLQEGLFNQLRSGMAPGFDFDRAERATPDERQKMVRDYLVRHMQDDPAVDLAREKLAEQAMVVPAALDLGMVLLQRAQAMADPAARKAELERAEKTFLAVRGVAGDSDQYMLRLGQVYYWLGKHGEGRGQFDKLLAAHNREVKILCALANVFRELGEATEARKLLEEAYSKAVNEQERQGAAGIRAVTAIDLDDKVKWLERSNADDPHIKTLLAETRGQRAAEQGNDDEAARCYREAIAIYDHMPRNAAVYNNGALACLSLFEVSGDRDAFDRATDWLDKAVALNPSDAIVLGNAAASMLRAAVQDLAGQKLNLRELKKSGQISVLDFLAPDQKALDELRQRARQHAGLRKTIGYLDRTIILAPKRLDSYGEAMSVHGFTRDAEALRRLSRQLAASKPDMEHNTAELIKYYQYKDDDSKKERAAAGLERAEALVKRLAAAPKGPAYAVAAASLVGAKIAAPGGPPGDIDALVALAEDAHHAAPSSSTYQPLIDALLQRAAGTLATSHPEYAAAVRGTGRSASATYSIALALGRGDALGKAARANKDVQRAVTLAAARADAFPETKGPWLWAMLAGATPNRDDLRAKCVALDEFDRLEAGLTDMVSPANTSGAFGRYWESLAAGKDRPAAREPLVRLDKLGVPLPLGLLE